MVFWPAPADIDRFHDGTVVFYERGLTGIACLPRKRELSVLFPKLLLQEINPWACIRNSDSNNRKISLPACEIPLTAMIGGS